MKAYEILPAGMTGSAKKPKPYEILPGAGAAAQGLEGKSGTCGCIDVDLGSPPSGQVSGNLAQPIIPGNATVKRAAAYEILPAVGSLPQRREAAGGGCNCPNGLGSSLLYPSQQPYDRQTRLHAASPANINQLLNQFLKANSSGARIHEKLLKLESLAADLSAGRSVRNAVALAYVDPFAASTLIKKTHGAFFPPSLNSSLDLIGQSILHNQASDRCDYLRAKLRETDALVAAIDQVGDPNLRAIHRVVDNCRGTLPDSLRLSDCGCSLPPFEPFRHPTAAESAADLTCLAVCRHAAGARRDEQSCIDAAIQAAREQGWADGVFYAELLRDRYRLLATIEEECGSGAAPTAKPDGSTKPVGSMRPDLNVPGGRTPKPTNAEGDLLSCDDLNELLAPAVAALILFVLLLGLGVQRSALATLEVFILSRFGIAVSRDCLR